MDAAKTKQQLLNELADLNSRIDALTAGAKSMHKVLQATLDSSPDFYIVIDKEWNIIDINKAMSQRFNKNPEELIGTSGRDLVTKRLFELSSECFEEVFQTGRPCRFQDENRGVHFDNLVYPLVLEQGEVKQIAITARDITELKHTQDLLRYEKDLAQDLINTAQAIVLILDTKGRIDYFNPYMEEISGYYLEEVKGKDWFDTFLPERDREKIKKLFSKAIKDIQTRGNVNLIVTRDGKERYIEWYDKTLKYHNGEVFGLLAIGQDITERKKLEEELRESEELYRCLVDTADKAGEGVLIVQNTDDKEGAIIFVNKELARITGYTREELVSMTIHEIFPPEELSDLIDRYRRRQSGEALPSYYEMDIVRKDGRKLPVEYSVGLTNYKGKVTSIAYMRDISERKQAEKDLQESKEQFEALIDNAFDTVVIVDKDQTIRYVSPSIKRSLGYEPEEFISEKLLNRGHPDDVPKIADTFTEVIQKPGHTKYLETRVVHKDGSWRTVEGIATNLLDHSSVEGIVINFRDITERKQAEEKYRLLLEDINDGYVVIQGGKVVYANKRYCDIFGYEPHQIVGNAFNQVTIPDDRQQVMDVYEKVLDGQHDAFERYEGIGIKSDGTNITIEASVKVIQYEGKPAFSAIVRDITQRKQAEEALRDSEQHHKILIETVSRLGEGIMIIQDIESARGTIAFANDAMTKILGCSREELLQMTFRDMTSPSVIREVAEKYRHWQSGKIIEEFYETLLLAKDGTEVPVEVGASTTIYQGRNAIIAFIRDITERKQAEERIRESEEKFRSIVENSSDQIFMLDRDYRFLSVNKTAAGISNRSPQEALGRSIFDMLPEETAERFAKNIKNVFDTGKSMYIEEKMYVEERELDNSTVLNPVKDDNGNVKAVTGIVRNITDLVQNMRQQELMIEILQILNKPTEYINVLQDLLVSIKQFSGVEAVGIRFKVGDDYPYVCTRGFVDGHIEAENSLCTYDLDGQLLRDDKGNPVLECMCGNIICGRFDPDKPFFTEGGSFWTNSTSELLTTTTEEDRQARTRNKCNGEGYESVALIPIQIKNENVGLIQLNDSRRNMFTEDGIRFLESIGSSIGIAFGRMQTQQELQRSGERYRLLSITDELTGLYNRRYFYQILDAEINRVRSYGLTFSLLMLDLDGFKEYNDRFGHISGDAILKSLAQTFNSTMRKVDMAFRYGGDEFTIILPQTNASQARKVVERIISQWLAIPKPGEPLPEDMLRLSAGIGQYPENAETADGLIFLVDAALFHSKTNGGCRSTLASELESIPSATLSAATLDQVYALASTVDARDPYTYGHSKRVAVLSEAIGREMGIQLKELSNLYAAALLHDIGKVGVPDSILTKRGKLTKREWEIMRTHSTEASKIVSHVKGLSEIVPSILHHHEWYNGSGYPDGLKGEDIPLGSRIIAVADAYDTMTTARPYKSLMSQEEALEELKRCSGTQFDPAIVDIVPRVISQAAQEGM